MELIRSFFSYLKKHWFSVTIFALVILLAGSSYVRFMVQQDYLVAFESECDPAVHSCFVGCEDDECSETYYYSVIERHAAELHLLCPGGNVLECDAVYSCQADVAVCSISYCDAANEEPDTCTSLIDAAS